MAPSFSSVLRYAASNSKAGTHHLIFFMCGNPGLVEYYRPFLDRLYSQLSSSEELKARKASVEIYSRSFAGFETAEHAVGSTGGISGRRPPYTLDDELQYMEQCLREAVASSADPPNTKVIVAGHSLGGWTTLELISRLRKRLLASPSPAGGTEVAIVAGICLFTPVTKLALSDGGRRGVALMRIPFAIPFLTGLAHLLAHLLPFAAMRAIIRATTGMPDNQAAVTAAFISSPSGVAQSLSLIRDELRYIAEDEWSDEVWGAPTPSPTGVPRARMYFYFAAEDQYVLASERADLLKRRARLASANVGMSQDWKPKMEIDGNGVAHAFVMLHSELVADKVAEYVEEIITLDSSASVKG